MVVVVTSWIVPQTTNEQTLVPRQKREQMEAQLVQQSPSTSETLINTSDLPSGGSAGSLLRLRGVVLGAPTEPFFIRESPDNQIEKLQEKVRTMNLRRFGHLKSHEIALWKVVVCSNVLFKLLITLT